MQGISIDMEEAAAIDGAGLLKTMFIIMMPLCKPILSPGAVFTSVAWAVFSYVFSIYLEYASNMSVLYGSLTTLVVVMLWLYFCMYLLFIGAEINQYLSAPELFTLDR